MKDCLRYVPMIGAREGELSDDEAKAFAGHLAACPSCRATAADFAQTDGLVAERLMAAANARDFGPFVDQVMARIGAPAAGARAAPLGVLEWLRHHWKGTTATFAPVLAAFALFMYVRFEGAPQIAMLELSSEGQVATVLQTMDGPVVLLDDDPEGS